MILGGGQRERALAIAEDKEARFFARQELLTIEVGGAPVPSSETMPHPSPGLSFIKAEIDKWGRLGMGGDG